MEKRQDFWGRINAVKNIVGNRLNGGLRWRWVFCVDFLYIVDLLCCGVFVLCSFLILR